jgi:uncharacterized protein (DUF488 family)
LRGYSKNNLGKRLLKVYTVGHSTRSLPEFLRLLKAYSVRVLVDVRRFPGSKKFPHFNRENLEAVLPRKGIRYLWLGKSLGGFRKGGYREHLKTPEFKTGLEKVTETAAEASAAIMCAEALWFRCHRRFIADRLARRGFTVLHILDEKRTYLHRLGRRVRGEAEAKT